MPHPPDRSPDGRTARVRRTVLAAALVVVAATLAPVNPSSGPPLGLRPAHAAGRAAKLRVPSAARVVRKALKRAFPGMSTKELDAAATAAGPLRVAGTTTLSGQVFATDLTFDPDAQVTVAPGTAFWVSGDLTLDGTLVFERLEPADDASPGKRGVKVVGPDAPDQPDTVFRVGGRFEVRRDVLAADGVDAAPVFATANFATGGRGGRGGSIRIATDVLSLNGGSLFPGRGGDGSNCTVDAPESAAGRAGARCTTRGGDGGDAGGVSIVARALEIHFAEGQSSGPALGRLALAAGGDGGAGVASGGAGVAHVETDCGDDGPDGGSASARGGAGGAASQVLLFLTARAGRKPAADAREYLFFSAGVPLLTSRLPTVDELLLVPPDALLGVGAPQSELIGHAFRGRGGQAVARGGDGAAAFDCAGEHCPRRGATGGQGGTGGDATAAGGDGGLPPVVRILGSKVLVAEHAARTDFGALVLDVTSAPAGDATARGGAGGQGGRGENGLRPGRGGKGGTPGRARATGGDHGLTTAYAGTDFESPGVFRVSTPAEIDTNVLNVGPITVRRILAGSAEAVVALTGSGGDGGDCCDPKGGLGGLGGDAGTYFKNRARATGGAAHGSARTVGVTRELGTGTDGDPGLACLGPPGTCTEVFGGVPGLPANAAVQLDAQSEPLETLAPSTSYELYVSVFNDIGSSVTSLVVRIVFNGRTVHTATISDPSNVTNFGPFAVTTTATGDQSVEIYLDDVLATRRCFPVR